MDRHFFPAYLGLIQSSRRRTDPSRRRRIDFGRGNNPRGDLEEQSGADGPVKVFSINGGGVDVQSETIAAYFLELFANVESACERTTVDAIPNTPFAVRNPELVLGFFRIRIRRLSLPRVVNSQERG
mmetsp:Transcript_35562/g.39335  ORF Transcript_35562/g.39335 Transcript_35562/m.39335 type:complete len:127 (-) Transcript_35562:103-483(-)